MAVYKRDWIFHQTEIPHHERDRAALPSSWGQGGNGNVSVCAPRRPVVGKRSTGQRMAGVWEALGGHEIRERGRSERGTQSFSLSVAFALLLFTASL